MDKESPFKCEDCSVKEAEQRNCGNRLELSDSVRVVENYTDDINAEILERGADKVIGIRGLRFYECPLSCITPESWDIFSLVCLIGDGSALLYEGGWGNQPYWLVEAMRISRSEQSKKSKDKNGSS